MSRFGNMCSIEPVKHGACPACLVFHDNGGRVGVKVNVSRVYSITLEVCPPPKSGTVDFHYFHILLERAHLTMSPFDALKRSLIRPSHTSRAPRPQYLFLFFFSASTTSCNCYRAFAI